MQRKIEKTEKTESVQGIEKEEDGQESIREQEYVV